MGAGKAVFRFREERAEVPAYQRDKEEFLFRSRDVESWEAAFEEARRQLSAFLNKRAAE